MSLFKRETDGSKLKFDFLKLSDVELKKITKLVEEHGGEVGEDVNLPQIKFMHSTTYKNGEYPSYVLYNIDFIGTCIKNGKLVNLHPFRLGPKNWAERCLASTFLHGQCCYKKILSEVRIGGSPVIFESSSESDNDLVPVVTNDANRDDDFADRGNQTSPKNTHPPVNENCNENHNENGSSQYETATDNVMIIKMEDDSMDYEEMSQSCLSPPMADSTLSPLASSPSSPTTPRSNPRAASNSPIHDNHESSPNKSGRATKSPTSTPNLKKSFTPQLPSQKTPKSTPKHVSHACTKRTHLENTQKSPKTKSDGSQSNKTSKFATNDGWMTIRKCSGNNEASATNYVLKDGTTVPLLRTTSVINPHYSGKDGKTCSNTSAREKRENSKTRSNKNVDDGTLEIVYTQVRVKDEPWNVAGPSNVDKREKTLNRRFSVSESSTDDEFCVQSKNVVERRVRTKDSSAKSNKSDSPNNSRSNGKRRSSVNRERRNGAVTDNEVASDTVLPKDNAKKNTGARRKLHRSSFDRAWSSSDETIVLDSDDKKKSTKERKKCENNSHGDKNNANGNGAIRSDDSSDGISMSDYENEKIFKSHNCRNIFAKARRTTNSTNYARMWRQDLDGQRPDNAPVTNMNYSREEQKMMIDWLLSRGDILTARPKGLKVWGEMLQQGLLRHRTPQSLQNHFQKKLLPRIEDFFDMMTPDQQKQFKFLRNHRGRY